MKIFILIILGNKNKEKFKDINIKYNFINKIQDDIKLQSKKYSATDLLLAPSKLESFGIIAQEAACCGLPTVAFSKTGYEDTIVHKKSGYIANNGDIDDFFNGINWCLNKDNHKKLSINTRGEIVEKFNEKKIANDYMNFYKDLIGSYFS